MEAQRFKALLDPGLSDEAGNPRPHFRLDTAIHGNAFNVDFKRASYTGMGGLFLNPPYDLDPEYGRLEHRFLTRFTFALAPRGVLIFLVPYHALKASARFLATHYAHVAAYRFPGEHFDAYKQVALFAVRTDARAIVDADILADVLRWAEDPSGLPELSAQASPYPLYVFPDSHEYNPLGAVLRAMDVEAVTAQYVPFKVTARSGAGRHAASAFAPPDLSTLAARKYPSVMPPKPAHIAAGIAAGVFDGVRIKPNTPLRAKLPDLLVKGVFDREYVPLEEKRDKDGVVTGMLEVQAPKLTVTALDLSTGTYHEIASESLPSGGSTIQGATTADLLDWYSVDMLRALLDHCPVKHDPANPTHQIPLAPIARPLFKAQAQCTMALVKELGGLDVPVAARRGKAAMILGEIGSGKTSVALALSKTIRARKTLVLCPPHLLDSWREQTAVVLPEVQTHVLTDVEAVERFAALHPETSAVGILSRETAKLGHSYAGVSSGKCPKCHAPTPNPDDCARKRLRCAATLQTPFVDEEGNVHDAAAQTERLFWLLAPILAPKILGELPPYVAAARTPLLARWAKILSHPETGAAARAEKIRALRAHPRVRSGAYALLRLAVGSDYEGTREFLQALVYLAAFVNEREFSLEVAQYLLVGTRFARHEYDARPYFLAVADLVRLHRQADPAFLDDLGEALTDARKFMPELNSWLDPTKTFYGSVVDWEAGAPILDKIKPGKVALLVHVFNILAKYARWSKSETCGEPLYQAVPEPRRVALANYIVARHPRFADMLVIDEAHEYSTDGSAQEQAAHRLAGLQWPTLYMTGSVMNGYAKSLFPNFWAMSPLFRAEFPRSAEGAFVDRYGYRKRLVSLKDKKTHEVVAYGAMSDLVVRTERDAGHAPGVLPVFVLRHLLPICATLHKSDLDLELPACREIPVPVNADEALRAVHLRLVDELRTQIKKDQFTDQSGKLWGALSELPSQLDRASLDTGNTDQPGGIYEIRYPDKGALVASAGPLTGDEPLPKEQWILDTVQAELKEGRNCLVLGYHINVLPRLAKLLQKATGEKVVILHAAKVPTSKRQAWIDANVIKPKRRIMVANPTTVQTGLNNLVHFQTQVWAENPACSPIIYRQTVGRSDRIGKQTETRIFFPYYAHTTQALLHGLLQRKVLVSTSTDGIDPQSSMAAAGMSQDLTLAALSVGRQLYKLLEEDAA